MSLGNCRNPCYHHPNQELEQLFDPEKLPHDLSQSVFQLEIISQHRFIIPVFGIFIKGIISYALFQCLMFFTHEFESHFCACMH